MTKGRRSGRLGGIELLAQEIADEAYRSVMETYDRAVGDSPIERLFCASLRAVAGQGHRSIRAIAILKQEDDLRYYQDLAETAGESHRTAYLCPQVQTAGWRVDFVIYFPAYSLDDPCRLRRLLIECDGHDFHERTKEQAARDRARDRLAQYGGDPIFRFTGSEIWNAPYDCADEVLQFMER